MFRRLYQYDPNLGHRFISGLKVRVPHTSGGYLVRTNAQGFRYDQDFVDDIPPGTKRILLFGDSYTAGESVSNGKRYSDFLEKEMPNVQIYNFATPGTGTDQQYLAFCEFARNMPHDLLMIAPLVENIRRNVSQYRIYQDETGAPACYAKPYFVLEGSELALRGVPPDPNPRAPSDLPEEARVDGGGRLSAVRDLVKRAGLERLAQKVTGYQPVPEYDDPQNPAWLLMRAILERWIREHPKPVLLMPIPLRQHVEDGVSAENYLARFSELAESTGCQMHDPLKHLLTYPRAEREAFRFPDDCHFTPAGHAAITASLLPVLQGLLGEPEPGKESAPA